MLFFRKFPVAVKFMDKKRGGGRVSRFSIESFFYLTLPKTCRGTIQCVTDFGYRKILCLRGLCHDFSWNFFVSQCRKTLQGNPCKLCFRKLPVARKIMDKREGEVSRISSNFFCLAVPKNFVGEPFCAVSRKVSGSNKFMDDNGGSIIFLRRVFFLSQKAKKICRGTL